MIADADVEILVGGREDRPYGDRRRGDRDVARVSRDSRRRFERVERCLPPAFWRQAPGALICKVPGRPAIEVDRAGQRRAAVMQTGRGHRDGEVGLDDGRSIDARSG